MSADDDAAALERGLAELEGCVEAGARPTRHHARVVLVALGGALRAGAPGATEALGRALRAVAAARAPWETAVREELELACGEHCLAVNPRYLERPNYDFEYTLAARERLECRIAAAAALGIPLDESLRSAVAEADEILRAHVHQDAGRSGTPGDGGGPSGTV